MPMAVCNYQEEKEESMAGSTLTGRHKVWNYCMMKALTWIFLWPAALCTSPRNMTEMLILSTVSEKEMKALSS